MKKIVLVPDSFKGTMSSIDVCAAMEEGIRAVFPAAEVVALPVADGGEGSAAAFLTALGGQRVEVAVTGPEGTELESFCALLPDGTAVIEMAAAAGLPQVRGEKDPERTTTFGVGQLLRHAAGRGAKRAVMCLGGSATNDGGCGAAAACGVRFLDSAGKAFVPVGGTLCAIADVDVSAMDPAVRGMEIVTMCDIDTLSAAPPARRRCSVRKRGRMQPWWPVWTRALPIWPRCCGNVWGQRWRSCREPVLPAAWAPGWRHFSKAACAPGSTRCWTRWPLRQWSGTRTWC